jgi:hypothetical protein
MRRVKGTMKPEQPERRDLCEMSASACEVRRDSLFRYCSASTMPVFLNLQMRLLPLRYGLLGRSTLRLSVS